MYPTATVRSSVDIDLQNADRSAGLGECMLQSRRALLPHEVHQYVHDLAKSLLRSKMTYWRSSSHVAVSDVHVVNLFQVVCISRVQQSLTARCCPHHALLQHRVQCSLPTSRVLNCALVFCVLANWRLPASSRSLVCKSELQSLYFIGSSAWNGRCNSARRDAFSIWHTSRRALSFPSR